MDRHITLTIDGTDYVCIPRAEYEAQRGKPAPPPTTPDGSVDGPAYTAWLIAHSLRAARTAAGLTQAQLARKLKKTQAMISQAEAGKMRIGERYLRAVLKACGLPADWKAPPASP